MEVHPTTRGKWRVEALIPSKVEFMYEIEDVRVDRSRRKSGAGSGYMRSEDAIEMMIRDEYGMVRSYDEVKRKIY